MLRQSVTKLHNSIARLAVITNYSSSSKPPCSLCPEDEDSKDNEDECGEQKDTNKSKMCKEHQEMVPKAEDLANMKSFELKSKCKSFHWCSEGHDR